MREKIRQVDGMTHPIVTYESSFSQKETKERFYRIRWSELIYGETY